MRSRFVMVDGLDGAGKGQAMEALKEWAHERKLKTFDLKAYWKEHDSIPELQEIGDADVIISAEPTYAQVGKGIRQEIIKDNQRSYSAQSTAFAFSLDREILYRRLIIPALKAGKYVIQERGIVTSLVYQPVQGDISLTELINLPGNRLALDHAPGLLIVLRVTPEVALERLKNRSKKDDAIFEKLPFQEKIKSRFESEWLTKMMHDHHAKVVFVDNNESSLPEFKAGVTKAVDDYFSS